MATKPPYAVEFRKQVVDLVHVGRSPAELSREFGVSAHTIEPLTRYLARRTSGWAGCSAYCPPYPVCRRIGCSSAQEWSGQARATPPTGNCFIRSVAAAEPTAAYAGLL